jgi:hypothetical protein
MGESTALLENTKEEERAMGAEARRGDPVGGVGPRGSTLSVSPRPPRKSGWDRVDRDLVSGVCAETDMLSAIHDLQDPSRTEPWTISHPAYTPKVSAAVKMFSDSDRG